MDFWRGSNVASLEAESNCFENYSVKRDEWMGDIEIFFKFIRVSLLKKLPLKFVAPKEFQLLKSWLPNAKFDFVCY